MPRVLNTFLEDEFDAPQSVVNLVYDMLGELHADFEHWFGQCDEGFEEGADLLLVIFRAGDFLIEAGVEMPEPYEALSQWVEKMLTARQVLPPSDEQTPAIH